MRTDYNSAGFARRFRRSRPLDERIAAAWVGALREAVTHGSGLTVVVDLGAGTGRFWPIIQCAWRPELIVAVDNSAAMLEAAGSVSGIRAVVGELDGDGWWGFRPDAVFCSMAVQYSKDPGHLCATVFGQLTERGTFGLRTATSETVATNVVLRFFPSAVAAELAAFPERSVIEGWVKDVGFATTSRIVRTQPAPNHAALILRAVRRGLPALQLVPRRELAVGVARFIVWSMREVFARHPVPWEDTLWLVGVKP